MVRTMCRNALTTTCMWSSRRTCPARPRVALHFRRLRFDQLQRVEALECRRAALVIDFGRDRLDRAELCDQVELQLADVPARVRALQSLDHREERRAPGLEVPVVEDRELARELLLCGDAADVHVRNRTGALGAFRRQ